MKKLIARIFTTIVLSLTFLTAGPLWGQNQVFKVGEAVEAQFNGKWESAVVTESCDVSQGCYGYKVVQGTFGWFVKSQFVRAHSLTAAEQAESDKDEIELTARAIAGNGIGAQYGVREPTTCPNKKAAPSAANVKLYVMCGAEGFDGVENVNILSDVTVQVAPSRAFNYARDARDNQVDVKAPVYDIRGSFKQYQCGKPHKGNGTFTETHNCIFYDEPVAQGSCYRDTFGDWHCSLTGSRLASTGVAGQMAPR